MEKEKKITKAGGRRKGAGRKQELPPGAKVTSFKCTPFERALLKRYLSKIRRGITQDNADVIYIDMRMNGDNIANLF
ncbi:hypothetical protein [uncultured Phascolarctobacterium sp.]|uniref:hypothetical protein n=1 Tax=uncultured Phascolarctobacterium sp. TaxID=512296 RepID=UPI0025DBFEE5|nr:hypothetical protein [uncultured Phascolarctobacterium sp.]